MTSEACNQCPVSANRLMLVFCNNGYILIVTTPASRGFKDAISSDDTSNCLCELLFHSHPNRFRRRMTRRFYILAVLSTFLLAGSVIPTADASKQRRAAFGDDIGLIQQMFYLKKMKPDVERIGVIWKDGVSGQEQRLEEAKRAVATIDGKLFVAYVDDESDVPEKFRVMIQEHDVQTLWIVEDDEIVSATAPRKYLIENTVKEGIPLLAPTMEWVDAGAPMTFGKSNGEVEIMLNKPAAEATGLQVPEKFKSRTNPVVAAN